MEATERALEEIEHAEAEGARLTKSVSWAAVRAAGRARDAYLLRERHRAPFERPLGRSPGRGREDPRSTSERFKVKVREREVPLLAGRVGRAAWPC